MKVLSAATLACVACVSQAQAAHVAIFDGIAAAVGGNLKADGHTIERLSASEVTAGALLDGGYEAFLFGRAYGGSVSQSFVDAVGTFMEYGGGLVTEFDGASILFSGYHETYQMNASNPQLGLIDGTIGAGEFLASSTPVDPIDNHPVVDRVGDPFHAGGGTQNFFTSYGLNGLQVETVATFDGDGSPLFPAVAFGAVLVGLEHDFVSVMFDAQDNPFDLDVRRLLFDAVDHVAGTVIIPPPPPVIPDPVEPAPAPVPLPASAWMLLSSTVALAALGLRRGRRRSTPS